MAVDHLTSSTDWASIIASVCGIVLFLAAVATFFARRFTKYLDAKLTVFEHKSTPNGGTTLDLGDTAARIETKVDETRGIVLWHLANHPGPTPPQIPLPTVQPPAPELFAPTRAQVAADNGVESEYDKPPARECQAGGLKG